MQDFLSSIYQAPREPLIPIPQSLECLDVVVDHKEDAMREQVTSLKEQGQVFEAWKHLHAWIATNESAASSELYHEALACARELHRLDAAKLYMEKLQARSSVLPEDLLCLARLNCEVGLHEEAAKYIQDAFESASDVEWHLACGYFRERASEFGWARTAYKLALRYQPDCVEALTGLISVALDLKEVDEAKRLFKNAESSISSQTTRSYLQARILLESKDDNLRAEQLLKDAVTANPWFLDAWYWLGHARWGAQRYESAEYAYRHAFLIVPSAPFARFFLGRTYVKLKRAVEAVGLLEAVFAQVPDSRAVAETMLEAYRMAGRDESAKKLETILGAPPPKPVDKPAAHTPVQAPQQTQPAPAPSPQQAPNQGTVDSGKLNQYQNLGSDAEPMSVEERDYHLQLSDKLMPGPMYRQYLQTIHQWMRPKNYVEIGVESGATLTFAQPQTQCIGIDPDPRICVEFPAPTEIYKLPSDAFFEQHDVERLLGGPIEFAFIDGLHVFDQVLRDFMNVEKHSSSHTVVVFHDCYPINEITQRPNRETFFWTGDPWKIVPCLKECRPDLEVMTIKTGPSGLAMVLGLDRNNTVLKDNYAEIEKKFTHLPYSAIEQDKDNALNAVANDWAYVRSRILAHREA